MFALIDRLWGHLLRVLMGLAATYVGLIMVAIIYQTVFRTMGWDYSPLGFVFIEYGFVYALFLGSPWLVRDRGHIYIEILTAMLSSGPRKWLSRFITLMCACVCFLWAWYSGQMVMEHWNDPMAYDELRAQFDIRLWVGTIVFPIGFTLIGVEFLRFVFASEPMHQGFAGVASERAELSAQQADIRDAGDKETRYSEARGNEVPGNEAR